MKFIGSVARRAVLLGGAVFVAAGSPARAAMDVFVDGSGMCAGHTPCFATIQAGVNHAGPAPATVSVFPGTYHESVDLGLMGSAIGGSAGNLTLATLDSAGMPTHGGVDIFPATGPALIESLPLFPGTIAVDGLTVKSPDSSGIFFASVAGLVSLGNVVSDGNAVAGFVLSTGHDGVSLSNSSFSGNGGDGIVLQSPLGFTFDGVTADDNGGAGASCSVMFGNVGVLRSSLSRNNLRGLTVFGAGGVTIDHVAADGNQSDGVAIDVEGPVQISQSSFTNSGGDGLEFSGLATQLVLSGVTVSGNALDGLSGNPKSAQITGSRFVGNGRDGIKLTGIPGGSDYHLTCNDIIGNITGLDVVTFIAVDAAHDYWGAPTGPTYPSNPKGTGDSIVVVGAGTVEFEPFLTLPVAASEFCGPRAAPALGGSALVLALLVLLIIAASGLARRAGSDRATAVAD